MNSMENVEAKELTYTTHGHKLRRGIAGGNGGAGQRGQREKIGTTVTA